MIESNKCAEFVRLKEALDSRMRTTAMALDRMTAKGKPYLRPIECTGVYNEKLRKLKDDEQALRMKILQESVDMAASVERKAALVFRFVEDKKRVDAQIARVQL